MIAESLCKMMLGSDELRNREPSLFIARSWISVFIAWSESTTADTISAQRIDLARHGLHSPFQKNYEINSPRVSDSSCDCVSSLG